MGDGEQGGRGGEDFTAPFEKDDSPDRQARHVSWKDSTFYNIHFLA